MVRGRGRGRTSATRGRGGSRSQRGRGVATRGRRGANSRRVNQIKRQANTQKSEEDQTPIENLEISKDGVKYFTTNATIDQHYEAQNVNINKYLATLIACEKYSIEITKNAKARSLAAAFARRDLKTMDLLLNHEKQYGFADVLKALVILDSGREIRAKEKKLKRHELSGSKLKSHKLGVIKNDINNLTLLKPNIGTVSGALSKHIRKWIRNFKTEEIEFFAIHMPTEPWKKIANIIHLNPAKDFPQAPWFLPYCFGGPLPADSMVDKCKKMNETNVNDLIKQHKIPYSTLKKWCSSFTKDSKVKIAEDQDILDTILWNYEDINCSEVDDVIYRRLENGENINLGYGKLMERLLLFKDLSNRNRSTDKSSLFNKIIPIAELRLKNFISTIDAPVAVLGDASSSMSTAIRTATIIASLLSAICSAKLSFFNNKNFYPKSNPTDIASVINVAFETAASGCTANAASLVPYYDSKEIVKTFIMVTDEEENTDAATKDGRKWRFYELFMDYREKIYPANLIFVSFLSNQHSRGQMYSKFVDNKVPNVSQFIFSNSRPDLTKLDSILGKICSNTSESFAEDVLNYEKTIAEKGVLEAWNSLKS
jgi:hypothetical protein